MNIGSNPVGQVPPTFQGGAYGNTAAGSNPGTANPFSSGDNFTVNDTSAAFDQAMAKLMGGNANVFTNQPAATQPQQQTASTPAGVTKEEIDWALAMEDKVKNQNYQPTQQEVAKYEELARRLQAGGAPQNTQQTAPAQTNGAQQVNMPANVTKEEVDWALELENKFKTQGYQPNAQETARYEDIARRLQSGNVQQGSTPQPAQITKEEVDWALALENKFKTQGYQPTPEETAKYQDIANRLVASQQPASTGNTVQQDNRDWSAWSQPFQVPRSLFQTTPRVIQVPATLRTMAPALPTYAATNVGPSINPPAQTGGAPSQQEIQWALALEDKVKKGYNPSESELFQYKSIADRLTAGGTVNAPQNNQQAPQQVPAQIPNMNQQNPAGTQPQKSTSIGDRIKNAWNALTG